MNNNELNSDTIRELLDHSLQQIDMPALSRLRDARAAALRRHAQLQGRPLQAWFNSHLTLSGPMARPAAWAVAMLLAITLIGGGYYWQNYDGSDDIDIAILTDELPLDNYVNN